MDVRESQNLGSAEQVLYSQFRRLVRVYARQRNSVTNDAHGPHPATRPLLLLGKPAETYRPGRREPRHAPPRRRQPSFNYYSVCEGGDWKAVPDRRDVTT
jgi:hypothetical protein